MSEVDSDALARHIGYSRRRSWRRCPSGANIGLSCGNPGAVWLRSSRAKSLLDLGSGGGFDVFIAAQKVGPTGRAIGVDMTAEMLAKARQNIAAYRERTGLDNVEFRLGEIEHLPRGRRRAWTSSSPTASSTSRPTSPRSGAKWPACSSPADASPSPTWPCSNRCLPPFLKVWRHLSAASLAPSSSPKPNAWRVRLGLTDIVSKPKTGYIDGMVDWQDPLYQKIIANLPAGTGRALHHQPGNYCAKAPSAVAARRCCS